MVDIEFQWTINFRTVVEVVPEDEIQLLILGLNFVPFALHFVKEFLAIDRNGREMSWSLQLRAELFE
jgi:hypothetical protein